MVLTAKVQPAYAETPRKRKGSKKNNLSAVLCDPFGTWSRIWLLFLKPPQVIIYKEWEG